MKLTDLNNSPLANAKKTLKEHFGVNFNVSKLNLTETKSMLLKVRKLANETRDSSKSHHSQTDASYMKLVVLEQALVYHYNSIYNKSPRIVVENEEVDQAQVIMAAQDIVDRLQDMIEDVSDMLVKEIPAVTDSVRAQFGTTESTQYASGATEAIKSLSEAIATAKAAVQSAMGAITGESTQSFDVDTEDDAEMGDLGDMDMEEPEDDTELDMPDMEEPEDEVSSALGRGRR